MNAREVATVIDDFVSGRGGRWDWDDFLSLTIGDPRLDAIRKRCSALPDDFPHAEPGHYCSDQGLDVLHEFVCELRLMPPED